MAPAASRCGDGNGGGKEGPTAFPWPGASDQAVGLIDQIVGADVAMMKRAVSGGNLRAVPTEATDSRVSALVGKFMKWTMSEMTEFNRDVGILANNVQMYGNGILGTYWHSGSRGAMGNGV